MRAPGAPVWLRVCGWPSHVLSARLLVCVCVCLWACGMGVVACACLPVLQIESLVAEVLPSTDPFDASSFDPVAYINTQFPSELSLSAPALENNQAGPPKLEYVFHQCKRNILTLSEEISKVGAVL